MMRMIAGSGVLIFHVPNGRNAGSVRMGGFWKNQGVVSGLPDIMMICTEKDGQCNGLAIELKVWPNKPSPEQLIIHESLMDSGWEVHTCYGIGEVESITKRYLGK